MGKQLTREAVVAAARDQLRSDGLQGLSLRKIAAQLGVTAPALYAHVDDKADLLGAIAQDGFDELIQRFEAIETTDPIERIREQSTAYIDQALADPELFRLMFTFRPRTLEVPGIDNELPGATRAFELGEKVVREAIESGDLPTERDPLLTALTLWVAVHGLSTVLLMGAELDDDMCRQLTDLTINDLLTGLRQPPT